MQRKTGKEGTDMILADKITELRKKNGWSQEELAEKLDVSRQSISKWESAQSVPDMSRILKLSEVFGVSTDFLLKDEMSLSDVQKISFEPEEESGPARQVSMEEAAAFLSFRDKSSGRVAFGVMMCILSPALLIALAGLQEGGIIGLSETTAAGIGLVVLLLLVGGAVGIFVTNGLEGQQYEFLEKERIDTAYGVDGMVKDRREKYRHTYSVQLVAGIVLCVLSAIPLFTAMIVFGDNDAASSVSVAAILLLVAAGVFLIVRCSIIWESYQMLLEEGEYTPEQKEEQSRNDYLSAIFWGSATALYLGVSFLTMEWHRTWIIWPVAGVAYGVVTAVAAVLRKRG